MEEMLINDISDKCIVSKIYSNPNTPTRVRDESGKILKETINVIKIAIFYCLVKNCNFFTFRRKNLGKIVETR